MRAKGIEFAILLIWLCRPALGWGDVGHRTVAYVAEHYLTEEGSKLVDELLPHNENFDISDAGTWADEQKQKRPQTEPWHYIGSPFF